MLYKYCPKHLGGKGATLPLSQFNKSSRTKDGYQAWCKSCVAEYNRHRRSERKRRQREKYARWIATLDLIEILKYALVYDQMRWAYRLSKAFNVRNTLSTKQVYEIFEAAEWKCEQCKSDRGLNLAHKRLLIDGGSFVKDNMIVLCNTCKIRQRKARYE